MTQVDRRMVIKDVLVFPKGIALAGSEPDAGLAGLADAELLALQGAEVVVERPSGESLRATVIEVRLSRSVADQRNVLIGVAAESGFDQGDVGGMVVWTPPAA